ncbi:MAG: Gfo/Idh/MocA family oxidoreductase [Pseudonocardiales bacterium]|nr:Gfo/Idh/MocA family oxidoreductase [Pseudonocardiales bacterium]
MTLRWGVIGTGGIARAFVQDLASVPGARVVGVGSRTQASADRFGDENGVPRRHASYEALAADPEIDAVYVATPHPLHAENALAAIAAGKHVLVEKPFTMDAAEAVAVVEAARAAGVFCMEAMWTRFLPHVVRVRELLARGAIGEVRTVIADHGQFFAPDPAHRLYAPELGGGALLDLGIYPVSFASMVLGQPVSITAVAEPAFTGVDGQTSAILRGADGAHAVVTCTLWAATPCRATITGTDGAIDIDPVFYAPTSFTLRPRGGEPERFEPAGELDGPGKGLRYEAAEVARCVGEGLTESPGMPLDETVSIMRTLDEIRRQTIPGAGGPAASAGR